MDSVLLMETMNVTDGKTPTFLEHPGLGNYILYGWAYKILHKLCPAKRSCLGLQNYFWEFNNYRSLMQGEDPILRLPKLYYSGRLISIAIALLASILFGLGAFWLTSTPLIGFLTTTCCMLSSGLLLQSLLIRTELSNILFVSTAFALVCFSYKTKSALLAWSSVFLSGTALGISVLTKIVSIPLLIPLIIATVLINYKPRYQSIITEATIGIFLFGISAFLYYYWQIKLRFLESGVDLFQVIIFEIWTVPAICSIAILAHFISLKWPSKITAITGSITAVLLGYLIAVPIVFWLTNIYQHYNTHWQRVVLEIAFSPLYITDEIYQSSNSAFSGNNFGKLFAHHLNTGGIDLLFSNWSWFINNSLEVTYVLLFAILGIISAKTNLIRVSIILLIASGLGMSLVMSARHAGVHYLIYQEIFLITAGSLGLGERIASLGLGERIASLKYEKFFKQFTLIGIMMIILSFAGKLQKQNTTDTYKTYNGASRNMITNVYKCLYGVQNFMLDMESIYGSNENIVRRIIEDSRLNGSDRDIDILALPMLRKHLSNANIEI